MSDQIQPSAVPPWRAILIGALLIPPCVYYGNYAYVVVQALLWGQTALLRGSLFLLFVLALVNLLTRKLFRSTGLTSAEMLIIYGMIGISVCVSGFGMQQFLINVLPAGTYFSTPENRYDRFVHLIPTLLRPTDHTVVADFYRGHTTMYRADILKDWAMPVTMWSIFIVLMTWVGFCMSTLVRKQWIEEERLGFPLVMLPVQLARAASGNDGLLTNKLMWGGFVLAGLLESIDYVNYFYPGFPYLQIKPYHWEQFMTQAPWHSIGTFTTAIYPFAIGIAYILSCEISFSCWFFYLVVKAENVLSAALGLNDSGGAHGSMANWPFIGEQGVGAFLVFGSVLLWRAGVSICREIKASKGQPPDKSDPLSPVASLVGAVAGILALAAFLVFAGVPPIAALVFWAIYVLVIVVLARIVSEAGAGWAWGPMMPIHSIMIQACGTRPFDTGTLAMFGQLTWFDSEFRDTPMPHQIETMKLAHETNVPGKTVLWALLVASIVGTIAGFWTYMHIYYEFGAASAKVRPALQGIGMGTLNQVDNWLRQPRVSDHGAISATVAGGIIVLMLSFVRQRYTWWPFHPIGYCLAGTASMEYMWFPFLLGWLIKTIALRYGGVSVYRRALPFFLGLILGDYIVPMLWGIWGTIENTQVYMAFPH